MKMGSRLEEHRKSELRSEGWEILPSTYGSGNGPDIVAIKPGPNGETIVLMEECKAGKSKLGRSNAGRQMSEDWIRDAQRKMLNHRNCDLQRTGALVKAARDPSRTDVVFVKQITRGTENPDGTWKKRTKQL